MTSTIAIAFLVAAIFGAIAGVINDLVGMVIDPVTVGLLCATGWLAGDIIREAGE